MIPSEITEDLRKGMSLEDCLIKHKTNLQTLFHNEYPKTLRNDVEKRYIEKKGKRFNIKKKINNHTYYFGVYSSFKDAKEVREELIRTGWKQNQVDNICERIGVERLPSNNEERFK